MSNESSPSTADCDRGPFPCCRHCSDDPDYHAENPPNSHETSCTTCDRDVAGQVIEQVSSREWAEAFLAEWARPYFGEDGLDAVACVQRAAVAALRNAFPTRVTAPAGGDAS